MKLTRHFVHHQWGTVRGKGGQRFAFTPYLAWAIDEIAKLSQAQKG
ncbi:MAG: hypothetical protein HC877_17940 [Thioploca sp.]|nr:hypothetical protein [Thioploca sp.]